MGLVARQPGVPGSYEQTRQERGMPPHIFIKIGYNIGGKSNEETLASSEAGYISFWSSKCW